MNGNESGLVARRFRIDGAVQGVFYRGAARAEALRLGLAGYIRNLPDGAVEAVACGTLNALDAFEAWLWRGPERAMVSSVSVEDETPFAADGFEIRR